jgi:hypothetical protein
LSKSELTKLVSEITGSPHDNRVVQAIVGTYLAAKDLADFDSKPENNVEKEKPNETKDTKERYVFK